MATEIEQRQVDSAIEIKAPILEELENDRELVQRAVNGELKARRIIAGIIDPLVSRKSIGLCKRYCGRNRFYSRCTVESTWGLQEETALVCEWGTFTVFFLRDKLLDESVLRRYEECGGTSLPGYLAAAASAYGLEEQWKDRRFGQRMSSPRCIEEMDPDAKRVFWWLYDGESVSTISLRLGMDEDKIRIIVRQVYDELGKAGLVHLLERQTSEDRSGHSTDGLESDVHGDNRQEIPRDREVVDVHWRGIVLAAIEKLTWQERFLLEAMFVDQLDDDQILFALRTLNVQIVDGLQAKDMGVGNLRELRNKVLVKIRKVVAE